MFRGVTWKVSGSILLRTIPVFILAFLLSYSSLDADFGWHLQSGYYYREHGIPLYDVFSYTASSFMWVNHEWGSDLLLSYINDIGGYGLAAVIAAGLWAAALLLAIGRRANPLVYPAALLALAPYVVVRPTAVTLLLFATCFALLRRADRRLYWLLPVVFVVWANLHAGFISGLALVGYYAVRRRSRLLLAIGLLCFAATFSNVYGIRIYEEVLRTLDSPQLRAGVQEWQSFAINYAARPLIIVWLVGFIVFDRKKLSNWVGLAPLLLVAALLASRNITLAVLAMSYDIGRYVPLALERLASAKHKKYKPAAVASAVAFGTLFLVNVTASIHGNFIGRETAYAPAAIAYLKQQPCPGNLFNSYNFGGYLIWKLPEQKVFIDGRMPSWDAYMAQYVAVRDNPDREYRAVFGKYGIQCALLASSQTKFIQVLQADGWNIKSQTPYAVLLYAPADQ